MAQNKQQTANMGKLKGNVIVGIDPGTMTGIAVWNRRESRFVSINTVWIHRAMNMILSLANELDPGDLGVRFEDARTRKFFKGENMAQKQQGAGSIKRDCNIWQDFLEDNCIPLDTVTAGKIKTKYSAAEFEKITGWKWRTSTHARDAAMLVFKY
jgi:hypothetical protein